MIVNERAWLKTCKSKILAHSNLPLKSCGAHTECTLSWFKKNIVSFFEISSELISPYEGPEFFRVISHLIE